MKFRRVFHAWHDCVRRILRDRRRIRIAQNPSFLAHYFVVRGIRRGNHFDLYRHPFHAHQTGTANRQRKHPMRDVISTCFINMLNPTLLFWFALAFTLLFKITDQRISEWQAGIFCCRNRDRRIFAVVSDRPRDPVFAAKKPGRVGAQDELCDRRNLDGYRNYCFSSFNREIFLGFCQTICSSVSFQS